MSRDPGKAPDFDRLFADLARAKSAWDDGDQGKAERILRLISSIALADAEERGPNDPVPEAQVSTEMPLMVDCGGYKMNLRDVYDEMYPAGSEPEITPAMLKAGVEMICEQWGIIVLLKAGVSPEPPPSVARDGGSGHQKSAQA